MMRIMTMHIVALLLVVGCGGAAGGGGRGPADVVRAYAEAIEAGRHAEAYRLMTADFRKRHSLARFTRMIKADPRGAAAAMRQLRQEQDKLQVQAHVSYGAGHRLELTVEEGQWRIAADPTDLYSQRTPAETVRSFLLALEQKRYDIVLRFVPRKSLTGLTAEKLKKAWEGERKEDLTLLIRNLKANLDAPIRQTEDRATMAYGEGFEVKMVREDGIWKVEDPD